MTDKFSLDALSGYVEAYRDALAQKKNLETQLSQWDDATKALRKVLTDALRRHDTSNVTDSKQTWIGLVDGKPVCRFTVSLARCLDITKLRENRPDIVERFTTPQSRERLTIFGQGK